jgi:hypothetical protein
MRHTARDRRNRTRKQKLKKGQRLQAKQEKKQQASGPKAAPTK